MTAKTIQTLGAVSVVLFALGSQAEPIIRYVAPTAVGQKDGTSWENATHWLPNAYKEVGANADGGEVRMAAGLYYTDSNGLYPELAIQKGVRLTGGWIGDEQTGETILVCIGKSSDPCWTADDVTTGVPLVDKENGKVNLPPVADYGKKVVWGVSTPGVNYLFKHTEEGDVSGASFENLTIVDAQRAAIYVTAAGADGLLVQNCKFYGCGHTANLSSGAVWLIGTVATVARCEFCGNRGAVHFDATSDCSSTVRGCTFKYNRDRNGGGTAPALTIQNNARVVVDDCLIERNIAYSDTSSTPAASINVNSTLTDGTAFAMTGCRVLDNYAGGSRVGGISRIKLMAGATARIETCAFKDNLNESRGWNAGASSGAIGYIGGGVLVVKDTYIGYNTSDFGTVAISGDAQSVGAAFANGNGNSQNENVFFVNCTVEHNYTRSPVASVGTFSKAAGYSFLTIVNCLVVDNDVFYGEVRNYDYCFSRSEWQTRVALVNSIFCHRTAADYKAVSFTDNTSLIANNYLQGTDLTGKSSGYFSSYVTGNDTADYAELGLRTTYRSVKPGVPALGVEKPSPFYRKGRPVYLGSNGRYYIYDDSAKGFRGIGRDNTTEPFKVLSAESAAEAGLTAASEPIPDVFGCARKAKPSMGPYDPASGLLIFIW